jgi:ATP-binding cassette, subfamily B (MDR/TAP), member 1
VRTAQAFGTQAKLAALYDNYVRKALVVDSKAAVFHGQLNSLIHTLPFQKHHADVRLSRVAGCGLGVFFFVIYSAYSLTFSFGATLVLRGEANPGTIVNVFFAILIGSFSLALMAPEVQGAWLPPKSRTTLTLCH